MDLLPAIDVRHGAVVRLRQGDAGQATTYGGDPAAVACAFAAAGARYIHVVDLDAALGEPPQRDVILCIVRALAAPAPSRPRLQVGGGLRDRADVAWALGSGCDRVVMGSLVARDPEAFAAIARSFPGRVVPALELARGELRVAGWTRTAGAGLDEVCRGLRGLPCPAVLVTDVERDGMLSGPNQDLARQVATATGLPALLSGGVRTLADLAAAAACLEIGGVVLGRALYERQIDLAAALALCAGAAHPAPAVPLEPGGGTGGLGTEARGQYHWVGRVRDEP
jgi:phosphoribosylformimino-5-aminoimidazole carboxamide ribotide isomerase